MTKDVVLECMRECLKDAQSLVELETEIGVVAVALFQKRIGLTCHVPK